MSVTSFSKTKYTIIDKLRQNNNNVFLIAHPPVFILTAENPIAFCYQTGWL